MTEIRLGGDPILKLRCRPVVFGHADEDAQGLAAKLRFVLDDTRAAGVAAPQIGFAVRAFAVREERAAIVCFNPAIVARCDGEIRQQEGCLSYPGIWVEVRRAAAVIGRWQDEMGAWRERKLHGLAAWAYQHELDHLEGRTLPDMVPAKVWERAEARLALARQIEAAAMAEKVRKLARFDGVTLAAGPAAAALEPLPLA